MATGAYTSFVNSDNGIFEKANSSNSRFSDSSNVWYTSWLIDSSDVIKMSDMSLVSSGIPSANVVNHK